jgi:mRNA interferase MazF
MHKDFDQWNGLKKKLDSKINLPTFRQQEVWWCNIGINIGDEENGKNKGYERPVLILRKFNNRVFFGIPLTTQIKEKYYYHKITLNNKEVCAMLSQLRLFDSKRLANKLGNLSQKQFDEIREILKTMI